MKNDLQYQITYLNQKQKPLIIILKYAYHTECRVDNDNKEMLR